MSFGVGNIIMPFKNRTLNTNRKVYIYRMIKVPGLFSIKQDNHVVGHTKQLMLHNCEFVVSKLGQARVRRVKKKNVHAYLKGYISLKGGMGTDASDKRGLPARIQYNPYMDKGFMCFNLSGKPRLVKGADCAMVNENGLSAAYLY